MNDHFSVSELQQLIAFHGGPAVSIYMPAHRVTTANQMQEDTIRLKNLLREAETRLSQTDLRTTEARELLAPAQDLIDNVEFWRHQSDGLAIFLGQGVTHIFRLPIAFDTLLVVADNFHVKPLLSLLTNDGTFYVLAVSQNTVRVLRGSKHTVDELDVAGVPDSLAEALRLEDAERQLQFHTSTPPAAGGDRRSAIYHGHGGGPEDEGKDWLLRYFRAIDKGMQELLQDEQAPLIFAGVDYLLPIYQEANTYRYLMDTAITGNPEELRPDELHKAAWEIVAPHFVRAQSEALETYQQMAATNQAAHTIRQILPAAYQGRVQTAFVTHNQHLWGTFDPETLEVHLAAEETPDTYDLYDQFAVYTLMRKGQVFVVEPGTLPDGADATAIFRY